VTAGDTRKRSPPTTVNTRSFPHIRWHSRIPKYACRASEPAAKSPRYWTGSGRSGLRGRRSAARSGMESSRAIDVPAGWPRRVVHASGRCQPDSRR
jgi:hypothetical protein